MNNICIPNKRSSLLNKIVSTSWIRHSLCFLWILVDSPEISDSVCSEFARHPRQYAVRFYDVSKYLHHVLIGAEIFPWNLPQFNFASFPKLLSVSNDLYTPFSYSTSIMPNIWHSNVIYEQIFANDSDIILMKLLRHQIIKPTIPR